MLNDTINIKLDFIKKVTGTVGVCGGAKFSAPALTTVTGSVSVSQGAEFDAPVLTQTGHLYLYEKQGAKFNDPKLRTIKQVLYETKIFGS